jgi:hypothetical protein
LLAFSTANSGWLWAALVATGGPAYSDVFRFGAWPLISPLYTAVVVVPNTVSISAG